MTYMQMMAGMLQSPIGNHYTHAVAVVAYVHVLSATQHTCISTKNIQSGKQSVWWVVSKNMQYVLGRGRENVVIGQG